jgi:hypothetical protein
MERQHLPATLSRGLAACTLLTLLTLLLGASGCVTTESFFANGLDQPPPKACQVTAVWKPQVQLVPDTVHEGRPMPAMVGTLYLFGEQAGEPLPGDGTVHLEMSVILPERPHDGWIPLDGVDIDKASLKKLAQSDYMKGTSYAMFLPLWHFRPDVTQIQMTLAYTPEKGTPLFNTSRVSLNPVETPLALIDSRQELGDRRRYVAPQAPGGQIQQAGYAAPAVQPAPTAQPTPAAQPTSVGQQIWPLPQRSGPIVTQTPWVPPGGWENVPAGPK